MKNINLQLSLIPYYNKVRAAVIDLGSYRCRFGAAGQVILYIYLFSLYMNYY